MISRIGLNSIAKTRAYQSLNLFKRLHSTNSSAPYLGPTSKLSTEKDILLGDYPNLEPELYQKRDPYLKYDDQQNRRNFNQTLHAQDDLYNMWSPDYFDIVSNKTAVKQLATFFAIVGAFATVITVFFYPQRQAIPRNYPHDGLAKAFGARNEEEAAYLAARVDKTA